MAKNYHITPSGKQWQVKGEGNEKATRVFPTQKSCIEWVKNNCGPDVNIYVHRPNGEIRAVEKTAQRDGDEKNQVQTASKKRDNDDSWKVNGDSPKEEEKKEKISSGKESGTAAAKKAPIQKKVSGTNDADAAKKPAAPRKTAAKKKQPKDITVAIPVQVDEETQLSAKELLKKKKELQKADKKKQKAEAKEKKRLQQEIKKMKE